MQKRSVFDKCKVDGCDKHTSTTGVEYCSKHLTQIQRYGEIRRSIYDPNEIEICDGYALMSLYNKDCTVKAKTKIDLDDVEKVSQHKWRFGNGIYVDNPKVGYLHRFVIDAIGEDGDVDHINHDKLDNRKENLRLCTHVENSRNKLVPKHNTSGAKGVHWSNKEQWYIVYLNIDNKILYFGKYACLIEAAKRYNEVSLEHYGEFALLNDIDELQRKVDAGEIEVKVANKQRRAKLGYLFDITQGEVSSIAIDVTTFLTLKAQCFYYGKKYGRKFTCVQNENLFEIHCS